MYASTIRVTTAVEPAMIGSPNDSYTWNTHRPNGRNELQLSSEESREHVAIFFNHLRTTQRVRVRITRCYMV